MRNTYRIILAQLNAIASNESRLSCYISHHKDSIEAPESKGRNQCSPCGMRKGQSCVNKLRAVAKSETKYSDVLPEDIVETQVCIPCPERLSNGIWVGLTPKCQNSLGNGEEVQADKSLVG